MTWKGVTGFTSTRAKGRLAGDAPSFVENPARHEALIAAIGGKENSSLEMWRFQTATTNPLQNGSILITRFIAVPPLAAIVGG